MGEESPPHRLGPCEQVGTSSRPLEVLSGLDPEEQPLDEADGALRRRGQAEQRLTRATKLIGSECPVEHTKVAYGSTVPRQLICDFEGRAGAETEAGDRDHAGGLMVDDLPSNDLADPLETRQDRLRGFDVRQPEGREPDPTSKTPSQIHQLRLVSEKTRQEEQLDATTRLRPQRIGIGR